jgi:hypothetical protein
LSSQPRGTQSRQKPPATAKSTMRSPRHQKDYHMFAKNCIVLLCR